MSPRPTHHVLPFTPRSARTTPAAGGDASAPSPHTTALRAAWLDGQHFGERLGCINCWRWGALTGAVVMALLAAGAVAAAKGLGWL